MSQNPLHPPIGKAYTREFRDLDTRRLPSAPPRPGAGSATRTGIPDADMHAARLRAIADLPIIETSVAQWLEELAILIEGHAE